jgi:hypothetical protein
VAIVNETLSRLSVVRGFLVRGLRLGAIGAALGTTAAFAVTRLLDSVLYGVSATDARSFLGALTVVLGADGNADSCVARRPNQPAHGTPPFVGPPTGDLTG